MKKIRNTFLLLLITCVSSSCAKGNTSLTANFEQNLIAQNTQNSILSDNKLSSREILARLKSASDTLYMPSEYDYPFKTFSWKDEGPYQLTNKKLLELTKHPANTPVELKDIDNFFKVVTMDQPWHSPIEQEQVRKYRNMVKVIKDNLTEISVFRVGNIKIDAYIVGRNGDDLLGLSTILIETRLAKKSL